MNAVENAQHGRGREQVNRMAQIGVERPLPMSVITSSVRAHLVGCHREVTVVGTPPWQVELPTQFAQWKFLDGQAKPKQGLAIPLDVQQHAVHRWRDQVPELEWLGAEVIHSVRFICVGHATIIRDAIVPPSEITATLQRSRNRATTETSPNRRTH